MWHLAEAFLPVGVVRPVWGLVSRPGCVLEQGLRGAAGGEPKLNSSSVMYSLKLLQQAWHSAEACAQVAGTS